MRLNGHIIKVMYYPAKPKNALQLILFLSVVGIIFSGIFLLLRLPTLVYGFLLYLVIFLITAWGMKREE